MRTPHRLLLIVLAVVSASPALVQAAAPDAYAGTWVRTEQERDDALRNAEIERISGSMSVYFRGFARAVMRRRMRPSERYVVESSGDTLAIRSARGAVYPIDGQPYRGNDDQLVTTQWSDGAVHQSWTHGESHGTAIWRLDEAGRLSITETVYDPHFDGPVQYSTTYRRLAEP